MASAEYESMDIMLETLPGVPVSIVSTVDVHGYFSWAVPRCNSLKVPCAGVFGLARTSYLKSERDSV